MAMRDVEALCLGSSMADMQADNPALRRKHEEQARRAADREHRIERVPCEFCGGQATLGPPVTRIPYVDGVPQAPVVERKPRCPKCEAGLRTCRYCRKRFKLSKEHRRQCYCSDECARAFQEERTARLSAQQAPKEEAPMPATAPVTPDRAEEPMFPELDQTPQPDYGPPAHMALGHADPDLVDPDPPVAEMPSPSPTQSLVSAPRAEREKCACGCGKKVVTPGSRYLRGHHMRAGSGHARAASPKVSTPKRDVLRKPPAGDKLCECGCGATVPKSKRFASQACAGRHSGKVRRERSAADPGLPPPSPELKAAAAPRPASDADLFIDQVVLLARTYSARMLQAAADLARAAEGAA